MTILTVLICEAILYGCVFMNEFFEYIYSSKPIPFTFSFYCVMKIKGNTDRSTSARVLSSRETYKSLVVQHVIFSFSFISFAQLYIPSHLFFFAFFISLFFFIFQRHKVFPIPKGANGATQIVV